MQLRYSRTTEIDRKPQSLSLAIRRPNHAPTKRCYRIFTSSVIFAYMSLDLVITMYRPLRYPRQYSTAFAHCIDCSLMQNIINLRIITHIYYYQAASLTLTRACTFSEEDRASQCAEPTTMKCFPPFRFRTDFRGCAEQFPDPTFSGRPRQHSSMTYMQMPCLSYGKERRPSVCHTMLPYQNDAS